MKRIDPRLAGALTAMIALAGCVQTPVAPTVAVMPGTHKTADAFSADQAACQQMASAQTAPQAQAATNQAVGTALFTTALGAALGAAVGGGGWHGDAGRGAGIGAGGGAVVGSALGASQAGFAQTSLQQQFDAIYAQCMAAHGNQVPGLAPPPYAGPTGPYSGMPAPYSGPPPYGGPYPGMPVPPPPGH
jgi:hypothetical protein